MAKNYCQNCNTGFYGDKCNKCGYDGKKKEILLRDDVCEKCGRRGRNVNRKEDKEEKFLCFWCYHAKDIKPRTYKTKAEAMYYKAIEKYYLVPLFYGDEINLEKVQEDNDEKLGITERVQEAKRLRLERESRNNINNSFPNDWK